MGTSNPGSLHRIKTIVIAYFEQPQHEHDFSEDHPLLYQMVGFGHLLQAHSIVKHRF
jgi:hypothetical protein